MQINISWQVDYTGHAHAKSKKNNIDTLREKNEKKTKAREMNKKKIQIAPKEIKLKI